MKGEKVTSQLCAERDNLKLIHESAQLEVIAYRRLYDEQEENRSAIICAENSLKGKMSKTISI